jgi:uroporphyrinogen decarboxylase
VYIRKVTNEFNTYYEFHHFPLAEAKSLAEIDRHSWPSLDWWDYSAITSAIQAANRIEPRAILTFCGGTFETSWYMRGFETFLVDLCERPDIAAAICGHVETYCLERTLRVLDAADGQVDIVRSGGDNRNE